MDSAKAGVKPVGEVEGLDMLKKSKGNTNEGKEDEFILVKFN